MNQDKSYPNQFSDDEQYSIENKGPNDSEFTIRQTGHHRYSSLPTNILQNSQPYEIQLFGIEDDYISKYEEIEQIGEGAAAVVKKCRHKEENQFYATKVMRNRDLEKEIASRAEFDLLNSLERHPNIIKAKEFISTEQWTYFVMEHAEGLELQEYLDRYSQTFTVHKSSLIRQIVGSVLSAVAHLHTARVCHKDIKPENIMVKIEDDQVQSLKLVDFNISQKAQNDSFTMIAKNGTPMFIAPEMERNQQYNHKVDIWGVGSILCYLLHRKIPHNGCDFDNGDGPGYYAGINQQYKQIRIEELQRHASEDTTDLKQWHEFLLKLVDHDPEKRPEASQALNDNVFRE